MRPIQLAFAGSLAVLFCGAVACSSGGSSGSPSVGTPPEAEVDAGTGGQPDAGAIGQPDAGGGVGQPDAGGGVGQPDAGGGSSQPDGGTVGQQDECTPLVPGEVAAPSATVTVNAGRFEPCRTGSSDGLGDVALIVGPRPDLLPLDNSVVLFDPAGNHRGTYAGFETILTEQLDGFELRNRAPDTDVSPPIARSEVVAIDGAGSVVGSTGTIDASVELLTIDPLGGVVAAWVPNDRTAPPAIVAYDERARLRWRTALSAGDRILAVGVDRQGNTLALLDGSSRFGAGNLAGIWLDHSGNAGQVFEAAAVGSIHTLVLAPRVGSGLFLQRGDDGRWIAQFDAFGAGQAPPSWLESRPSTTLHVARGGRGYAVISPAASAGLCQSTIEVVAPSGKSCGTAVFAGEPSTLGGPSACAAGLTVGYDGTVIEKLDEQSLGAGGSRACRFRWWTGFLR